MTNMENIKEVFEEIINDDTYYDFSGDIVQGADIAARKCEDIYKSKLLETVLRLIGATDITEEAKKISKEEELDLPL